jgi:glucose-1-phosphate thymidylyltransferase
MKALILAARGGTRLRPLTDTMAEPLLPIMNRTILFYAFAALSSTGIHDVGIVVGDRKQELFAAIGDGCRFGLSVTYLDQGRRRGLAHTVLRAERFLGAGPFLLYLDANLVVESLGDMVRRFHEEKANAQVLLGHVPNPQRCGIAEVRDGSIVRLIAKPLTALSNLGLAGVYIFDHHIFDAAKAIEPSAGGEVNITDSIQWLIEAGFNVRPHVIQSWWKQVETVEDVLEANRIMLGTVERRVEGHVTDSEVEGMVVVEAGAKIVESVIRGPAFIGRGAVVEQAYIGPFTSIGEHVMIRMSRIAHSIVLDGSSINNVEGRIESSLVGRNVTIEQGSMKPQCHTFMLADQSHVRLT